MAWIVLAFAATAAVFIVLLLMRRSSVDRGKSAHWNDLSARGKLMTVQLAQLRELQARKDLAAGGTPSEVGARK